MDYWLDEAAPAPGAEKTCDSGVVGEPLQLEMIEAMSNVPVSIAGVEAAPPGRLEELDIALAFMPEPALMSWSCWAAWYPFRNAFCDVVSMASSSEQSVPVPVADWALAPPIEQSKAVAVKAISPSFIVNSFGRVATSFRRSRGINSLSNSRFQ